MTGKIDMTIMELTDKFGVNDSISTRYGDGVIQRIEYKNSQRFIYMLRKKDNKVILINGNDIITDSSWAGIGFDPTDRAATGKQSSGAVPAYMNI